MDVWIHMKLGNLQEGYSTIRVRVTDMVGKTYTYEHAIGIQYYWASTQYGGSNGVVDTDSEIQSVINAMAATTDSGRQALWAGLDPTSRSNYINRLLPTAEQARGDFGLDGSDATTRAVFSDPTTHGTIAQYGAPMTQPEQTQIASDAPPGVLYDGSPASDVLASSYQSSTDDGNTTTLDSTGNIGCDASTETGCAGDGTTTTYGLAPSDPTTDDLTATAATTNETAAVQAGASRSWFNRYGARADADSHATSPRSGLYAPVGGADCTNFVSQVWHLGGGLHMTGRWFIKQGLFVRTSTYSWTLVRNFVNYMVNKRQIAALMPLTVSADTVPSGVEIGDAIEYDWGRGEGWSHLAVVVNTSTAISRVSQHSNNRRESRWNLGWFDEPNQAIKDRMRARAVHVRVA